MEDPWGSSPWAAASDTSLPKIDLPAAPQSAHFPVDRTNSPRRSIQGGNAWEEDDAWGGWNDAGSGGNSPAWGRSPGLRPVARSRGVSPDPWVDAKSPLGAGADSAISMGMDSVSDEKRTSSVGFGEPDIWLRPSSDDRRVGSPAQKLEQKPASPKGEALQSSVEDDEPPELTRRPSKVQDLVVMYDGIARRSVSPSIPSPEPVPQRKHSDGNCSLDDKEALARNIAASVPAEEEPKGLPDEKEDSEVAKTRPELYLEGEADHRHLGGGVQVEGSARSSEYLEIPAEAVVEGVEDSPKTKHPKNRTPIKKVDIPYPVDFSQLDALFPLTEAINTTPEPVPDVIIDDTFAAGSERKAWYLLSRTGSLRMHNMGEDENYVRMDWRHSTVRMDTLKTVRRWLEEDSITGRVVLGRKTGALGASMFNWDSTAPEVDVGALLGKRGGHRRGSSKGSVGSLASPVAATFGWSSQPSSPVAPTAPPAGAPTRPQSLIMPPKLALPRQSIDEALSRPVQPPPQVLTSSVKPQKLQYEENEENDEDEWGEMVAYPATAESASNAVVFAPVMEGSPLGSPIRIEPSGEQRLGVDASKRQSTQDSGVFSMSKASGSPRIQSPTSPGFRWEASKSPIIAETPPRKVSLLFEAETSSALPSPSANEEERQVTPLDEMLSRQSTAGSEPWTPDDEETVKSILQGLPNLSYMLRRH